MTIAVRKKCPAAAATAGTGGNLARADATRTQLGRQRVCRTPRRESHPPGFLWCSLHDVRITDRFPRRCPFTTAGPVKTLITIKNVAWSEIGKFERGDLDGALALLHRERICETCVVGNLGHATVRRLRRGFKP